MNDINILNDHLEMCLKYWNGEITEEEFDKNQIIYISKEVDNDMQKDRFY